MSALLIVGTAAMASPRTYRERERTYDVLHYILNLRIDERTEQVGGTVTMRLCPLKPITSLKVDGARMSISSVTMNRVGRKPVALNFVTGPEDLSVTFPELLHPADTLALEIHYTCTPHAGLYFVHPDSAYPNLPVLVWSQGEMEENRDWFPCYDYPNDKATVEVHATVNERYTVISNGALLDVTEDPREKTKTYHWYCVKPIVSYLISVVVGEYAQIQDWYRTIPVTYYVYPSQRDDALRSFKKTPEMMKFFSERIGFDYPWAKYSQTVVAEFTYGGMENASAATLTDRTIHSERAHLDTRSEGLVAHELAHQWFGDLLTCRNWSHAWLNEGFATYFQALYDEASLGWDEFQHEMVGEQAGVVSLDTGSERLPTVTNMYVEPVDLFNGHIYGRGACILHMLRLVVGDELFWQGIRHYVDLHQYQCVTTDDFEHSMEDVVGQDLRWFFDEWVERAGYPALTVSADYDSVAFLVRLDVRQTQQVDSLTPLYRMPVLVEAATEAGNIQQKVWLEPRERQHFEISCRQRPKNIVFDKGHWLLKTLSFSKPADMWLYQLAHGDAADRIEALENLVPLIDQDPFRFAVGKVLELDRFWGVRQKAAEVLGKATQPDVLRLLAPAFGDREARVRGTATASLRNFRTLDALVALGNIFAGDSSDAVVVEAMKSLIDIDTAHATEYRTQGLERNSHDDIIRTAAIHSLGQLRSADAKRRLLSMTVYGQPLETRRAAMEALAQNWQSDAETRKQLEELVNDRNHHVRRKAIEQLGTVGDQSTRRILQALIEQERNPLLRREARRAVLMINRNIGPRGD